MTVDVHDTARDDLAAMQALDSLRASVRHLETAAVCMKHAAARLERVDGVCGSHRIMLAALAAGLVPFREQAQISMDALERTGAR